MRNSITDTVKAATTAAAELRKRESQNYPLTPHSWYQLKGQEDELNAPVLCASCFLRIDPEGEVKQFALCPAATDIYNDFGEQYSRCMRHLM